MTDRAVTAPSTDPAYDGKPTLGELLGALPVALLVRQD